jgi:acyl-CoA thioester hydrolase
MSEPFRTQRLVEFHDTDMAGIMHFASFFHYMESAEHELLRSVGLSIHSVVNERHISFPRVSATCDYMSPAYCEDVLDIAIRVTRVGGKSLTYSFEFTKADKLIAEGRMTSVCCLVKPGTPLESVPIPQEILAGLQPFVVT